MALTAYLNSKGFYQFEGNSSGNPVQTQDLSNIILSFKGVPLNVMEIGFNAGHSAETLLKHTNVQLTSFDLGMHEYIHAAKEYIDLNYPGRHQLILGDSRMTVPSFIENNRDHKFDIIFIDGGHDYDIAKADVENCRHLAHENTIVILDDTVFHHGWEQYWTVGPTRVWIEHLLQNKILGIESKDYSAGRGMSWGKYKLTTSSV